MRAALTFLDRMPLWQVLVFAGLLGLSPFVPEPHLVEKLGMLMRGDLVRLIDMVDLVWHGVPVAVGVLKIVRVVRVKA
jgi:hypothetical protein